MRRFRLWMLNGLTLYSLGLLIYCVHQFIAAVQQDIRFSQPNAVSGVEMLHLHRWPTIIFSAILPLQWATDRRRPWQRSRLRQQGRCINCSYDLTGNVSGVCPECGTQIIVS